MKITDYMILYDNDAEQLETLVRETILDGWEPLGGVSVSLSESDEYKYVIFAQALLMRESEDEHQPA